MMRCHMDEPLVQRDPRLTECDKAFWVARACLIVAYIAGAFALALI